ncbi:MULTISPECIES: sigma-70 family RNA polymerase sigma factor [unclassified Streptomyces]|uniref:RNA polymerase sigma factor n=1 Tax=unclassified Streptomyces TaxID=2593676 RepID=UPI002E779159|nr:sigma-70 family RNA polymerase sigma factor [Streptomyces sp. JV176]MEE1799691.1 sigma-70 family RNA polymerase sigma factor [Streptomyces sp. JV176]
MPHIQSGLLVQVPASLFPASSQARADFAHHYRDLMPRLTVFVMRHGANRHEATEAAQAAFALAWESWETINRPQAWLRRVAYRQLLKQRGQREHAQEDLPDRPGGLCPAETAELGTQEALVLEILASLPMRQRQAFAWTYDGFSAQETAEHLGISPEAVRQNLARARKHLKQAWQSMKEGTE